jgi:hypothetical protein
MPTDRGRLDKVLAIAINPGVYEEEAIAALLKARELVKKDPSLAHPEPPPLPTVAKPVPTDEASFQVRITNVPQFWLNIFLNMVSQEADGPIVP